MSRLCCFLNSPDQLFDLRVMETAEMWTSEPNSILPIMWQLIRRLEHRPELVGVPDSVTSRVLATMIVADLWTKNIHLEYVRPPSYEIVPPDRGFHRSRAERYKNEGKDALAKDEAGRAIDLYGVAISLDPGITQTSRWPATAWDATAIARTKRAWRFLSTESMPKLGRDMATQK